MARSGKMQQVVMWALAVLLVASLALAVVSFVWPEPVKAAQYCGWEHQAIILRPNEYCPTGYEYGSYGREYCCEYCSPPYCWYYDFTERWYGCEPN